MIEELPAEAFLDVYPEPIRAIAGWLRVVVRGALPDAVERVRVGWGIIGYDVPVGRRWSYVCWVMPERHHIHLGFRYGVLMDDPGRLLGGDARLARWLTFRPGDRVDMRRLRPLVLEGARVGRLSTSERTARRFDRELRSGLGAGPE